MLNCVLFHNHAPYLFRFVSLLSQRFRLMRNPTTLAHRSNRCDLLALAYHESLPKFLSLVCQQNATCPLAIRHNTVFISQIDVLFPSIKLRLAYSLTQNPIRNLLRFDRLHHSTKWLICFNQLAEKRNLCYNENTCSFACRLDFCEPYREK